MLKKYTRQMLISSMYAVITLVIAPASFGPIQFRISEVLLVLMFFDYDYIYGLTFGCFLANLIGLLSATNPIGVMDIIFGSSATFISCVMMYNLRERRFKGIPLLSFVVPAIINGIIVGLELAIVFNSKDLMNYWLIYGVQVFVGELGVLLVIGIPVYLALKDRKING
ncbi:MAG TPA: QueT transporter family protein [Erysipelotrichaceae bacterium]|nr:QueT transporter family protein [Erysipelotrichaceae bacterium]HQA84508.1 QueT transporter family protein [Erysipelotrichaceae bacterium]